MVGSWWRWCWWLSPLLRILLLCAVSSVVFVNPADGWHASGQCVQAGQAHSNLKIVPRGNWRRYDDYYRWGYWTIGTRKFDAKYMFLDLTYTPAQDMEDFPGQSREPGCPNGPPPLECQRQSGRRRRSTSQRREKRQATLASSCGSGGWYLIKDSPSVCPYEWNWFSRQERIKCPYCWTDNYEALDLCPLKQVNIRTYAVKEVVNASYSRVLQGWLYVEVELTDDDDILGVYVQMRDEFFNTIGEFVTDPNEQCPIAGATQTEKDTKSEYFQRPTPYQILPCSAVGYREAKLSNSLYMVRRKMLKTEKDRDGITDLANWDVVLPPEDKTQKKLKGIRFTWRLNEYWCNRHLRFRPEALIFTQRMANRNNRFDNDKIMRRAADYWITHKWYGAADIKRENTKLACDDEAIDYRTGKLKMKDGKLVAPWLLDTSVKSTLENDYVHRKHWECEKHGKDTLHLITSCQAHTVRTFPGKDSTATNVLDTVPSFAGRCKGHFKKNPSHDALQDCNLLATGEEFKDVLAQYPDMQTYKEYVNVLYVNRTKLCSVPCNPPDINNPDHLEAIKSYNDTSGESKFMQITVYNRGSREENKYETAYVGRKYHAALALVWSMFLVPVGIFIARYLKETCMDVTCTGAHLWFWVHCATAIMGAALMISSIVGLAHSLRTWGRNQDRTGVLHRTFGYISVGLFALMILLGGFRGIHPFTRYVLMTAHSVLGFLIYVCNMVVLFLSMFIPASPSMGDNCDDHGNPTDVGPIFYVVGTFIVLDAALHIVMTVMQCMIDRKYGIRRPWFCPIIPFLPHNSAHDMKGSALRKLTMLFYVLMALILTMTAVGMVMGHVPANENCLTLTGYSDCENPWGCSSISLSYFNKISSERNTSGSYTIVDNVP